MLKYRGIVVVVSHNKVRSGRRRSNQKVIESLSRGSSSLSQWSQHLVHVCKVSAIMHLQIFSFVLPSPFMKT